MTTFIVWDHFNYGGTDLEFIKTSLQVDATWEIVASVEVGGPVAAFEATHHRTTEPAKDLNEWMRDYLANGIHRQYDAQYRDECERRRSDARVRAMELGLSPWPSASGWAPMDLPWKERRILIGIVEGIASLARVQACSGCGERMCGHMNESVCPLCGEHVCGDHSDDSPPTSEPAPTVGADS